MHFQVNVYCTGGRQEGKREGMVEGRRKEKEEGRRRGKVKKTMAIMTAVTSWQKKSACLSFSQLIMLISVFCINTK